MTRFVVSLLLLPALLFSAPSHKHSRRRAAHSASKPHQPTGPVSVISDVSVVDVLNGSVTQHLDIVIQGDRISDVHPARTKSKTTRYAIPGLWDMHVHLWYPHNQFPLYIANGVTGVRDMGSDLNRLRIWQAAIAKGELAGPRIYLSGPAISNAGAAENSRLPVTVVDSPNEARSVFERRYDDGVNFVNIVDLSESAFAALAEASRHAGLPLAGQLPDSVSALTAALDRMSSMEHLFGLSLACSFKETELRGKLLTAKDKNDRAALLRIHSEIIDTYDPLSAARLFEAFRTYGVWQTPTLTLWRRMADADVSPETGDASLRYVEASVRNDWKPHDPVTAPSDDEKALVRREYEVARKLVRDMSDAGVPILAGTDTGGPWTVPGFELHNELALLVKAGLTPAQALRSATVEPARLMHKETDLGQVRKGYLADLVLLDANPLADIANAHRIDTIVLRGKQIDKAQLNRMLADAAAAASKS